MIGKVGGQNMEEPSIEDVMSRYEDQLLGHEGVVGIGVGQTTTGEMCIKVFVEKRDSDAEKGIPKTLEQYRVEIEEIGEVKAL
jgi:hypothetical protein